MTSDLVLVALILAAIFALNRHTWRVPPEA